MLGRATSWAYDGGLVTVNPFLRGGQLYHGTRADKVWTDEQQLQFQTSAPKKLHLPFMMGVWLGQRQGRDVKSILEKHYLGRDQALGEAAIHSSKPEQNLQNGLQSGPPTVARGVGKEASETKA